MSQLKAIFLDRDGTLNHDKQGYLNDPEDLEWITGAIKGLELLQELGYALFIITNQSGIGRGKFTLHNYRSFSGALFKHLESIGIHICMTYFCHHAPESACACRKPKTALLQRALAEWNVCSEVSYMVGDKSTDIEAGRSAGLKVALVGTASRDNPTEQFSDILEFADYLKEINP